MIPAHRAIVSPRPSLAAASLAVLLLCAVEARAADSNAVAIPLRERAVTLEAVENSSIKRVVLSPKAAERLDIKTGLVSRQAIVPTQMVGGVVVDPSAASTSPSAGAAKPGTDGRRAGELWIRVALSPPEWQRLAKDKPARVFPLQTRAGFPTNVEALPSGQLPLESAKSAMLSVFYVAPPGASGLALGDRVRAELPLEGGKQAQKVVPYSAVYYDAKGDAWVYINTGPLAFLRQKVTVERVAGDMAFLTNGPEVGTRVAIVGVSLLYGAEILGK